MKRHARTRQAISNTLREKGEPMTAEEIYHSINMRKVSNAKAVSNILKGMKNVKVIKNGHKVFMGSRHTAGCTSYRVNTYIYDDEGAEI